MGSTKPLSVAALSNDYEKSRAEMRRKYDGKEIIVVGYAATEATMPKPGQDQGSVLLTEKDRSQGHRVICWFTREQMREFSRVTASELLTVKGVFNGETSLELRFCELISIERG
ncbi:MAG TPA: hypothetical protein VLE19_16840 [Pyrinomonadaceae bacterium]|nr:hypothetical protein [Pyrinomonadaceae bacterium]